MSRIKQARRRLGLSQVELASAAGISPATVVEVELGNRQPQGRTIRKLATALGVEVADLVEEEEATAPKPRPPRSERPVEPTTGDIEHPPSDEGSDPLAGIVRLLSGLGREVAASNATSDELSRSLKVIDDAVLEAFNAYRSRLEQGEETDELTGATQELVAVSVEVEEALKEAAREEADPGKKAEIIGILSGRRSARSPSTRRGDERAYKAG